MELPQELQDLNAIRLAHDLSWSRLAAYMASVGFPVASRTLHYLVKGTRGGTAHEPHDRTLHKIREFLAYQQPIDAARDAKNARRRARRQPPPTKRSGGRSALSVPGGR